MGQRKVVLTAKAGDAERPPLLLLEMEESLYI